METDKLEILKLWYISLMFSFPQTDGHALQATVIPGS